MDAKLDIPVYINYGQKNFFKTYNLFKKFLHTVPYENLQFQNNSKTSAGVIVSPRNNSGIPWCNITIALLYAFKKIPFKIILDDLNFLDPEWKTQLNAVEETVEHVCDNLNTSYLKTSAEDETELDEFDYKEIRRLSILNGIWNVRNIIPSEKLDQYIHLSYVTLESNAKKIKKLYSTNIFEHCVHQSLVNNNGGLHKWFGRKYGIRVSCMDISFGRGLVGIKDVPGYHSDLPDIIGENMTGFLDYEENKKIAKNEAIKEHTLRLSGKDSKAYQVVSTNESDTLVGVDILIPINIFWDAASLGKNRFFENPLFWLQETIDFILSKTTARVAVREHPGERRFDLYGTGKKLGEYLKNQFNNHPRFRFISCHDKINTYSLIEQCKLVLPYTSTVGIEAGLMGKNVIIESSVYYKDQPFVVKAESKEDYFNKIKQFYEQYDQAQNNKKDNNGYEKALLLYFLLTQCSIIESKFGLDPVDFENWAPRGFDFLTRDENLMTAIEALISGKPFPYLNGKKKLKNIKDRSQRVIDWPRVHDKEIIQRINHLINLINNHNYEEALGMMPDSIEHDGVYLYPRAFVLAKLNRFNEANQALNRLNAIKPNHQYSRFLVNEVNSQNFVCVNKSTSKSNGNQVVGVVSPSYSGSTLLTAVLGAHSKIFAAGEVRWLIEKNIFDVEKLIERSKNLSKKDTVPWQNKTFRTANYRNVYKKIFEVIDSNFIIDSSKEPHHFQNIINNTQDNGMHFLFISLWKHPMRLLSSHLMHRWDRWEQFRNYARGDAINYVINDLYKKYISIKEFLESANKGFKTLFIKYEDIVENLQPTLQRILDEIHLEYEIGMENFGEKEQYMLGGNAGPRYKIAKIQNGIETEFASPIQRDFYQNMKGIEMDNNYRKFFFTDEIHSIYDDEKFKFLMNSLKYSNIY